MFLLDWFLVLSIVFFFFFFWIFIFVIKITRVYFVYLFLNIWATGFFSMLFKFAFLLVFCLHVSYCFDCFNGVCAFMYRILFMLLDPGKQRVYSYIFLCILLTRVNLELEA